MGPGSQLSQPSTAQHCKLCQMAPGQGTSQARGITKRWETHVNKSFCSLTLQSQPCLQPIFLPANTLPCMALLHPRHAQKGETGSCRSKTDGRGEAPEERLFVLSVYPHQGWIYTPSRRANETSRLPVGTSHIRRDVNELLETPQDSWFDPTWMQDLHMSPFTAVSFK